MGGPTPILMADTRRCYFRLLTNIKNIADLRNSSSSQLNIGLKFILSPDSFHSLHLLCDHLDDMSIDGSTIDYVQLVPNQFTNDGGKFINSESVKNQIRLLSQLLTERRIPLRRFSLLMNVLAIYHFPKFVMHIIFRL